MEDIKTMAEHFHSEGFSCAESMVRACNNCLNLHLSDDALRMASGLGGGLGGSGCVCGALNGACLIIGVVAGRKELTDRPKPEIYKDIREFQQLFTKHLNMSETIKIINPTISNFPIVQGERTADLVSRFTKLDNEERENLLNEKIQTCMRFNGVKKTGKSFLLEGKQTKT